jgi:hypothetical protein
MLKEAPLDSGQAPPWLLVMLSKTDHHREDKAGGEIRLFFLVGSHGQLAVRSRQLAVMISRQSAVGNLLIDC